MKRKLCKRCEGVYLNKNNVSGYCIACETVVRIEKN